MEMAKRPEKSGFSLTCSLLSQYIKEKGSFVDIGIGMPSRVLDSSSSGKPDTYCPPVTMNLLPEDKKKDSSSLSDTRSMELFPQHAEAKEPEEAQLTIFYGGKVLVFDNFPAEKAKDLMQIASKGQNFISSTPTTMASSTPPANFPAPAQPNFSDLPIARKASLHRFLQKRKDRISAQAPYQLSSRNDSKDVVTVEEEISQPWLGLGPHVLKLQLQKLTLQAL